MKGLHSYLNLHRRQQRLNQEELAFLLGKKNASSISRFELQKRHPDLEAAFACQVLFDIPPSALFPKLYEEVESSVMRRAYKLDQQLRQNPTSTSPAKLELLQAILTRAQTRLTDKEI